MRQQIRNFAANVARHAMHVWHNRRYELVFATMATVFLGLLYLFVVLSDNITEGDTQRFDERILLALRRTDDLHTPIGPAWLKGVMLDLTALGSPIALGLFSAALIGLLFIEGQRRVAWLSVLAIGGGTSMSLVLKMLFGRLRPSIVPHLREVTSSSFPSGHALSAAVVYLTIGVMLAKAMRGTWAKAYCMTCGATLALLVGTSRIYLGVHYPSDVLGGWIAGLTWASGCWIVSQFIPTTELVPEPEEPASEERPKSRSRFAIGMRWPRRPSR
jgi:undecaprenyl-diphosphatase